MIVLPPGNILQNMYLKKLLKDRKWNSFLEIGSGNGYISNIFLKNGLSGVGFDLNESACENNRELNRNFVKKGKYKVYNNDFLDEDLGRKYDLIISCMVIEHLNDDDLFAFIGKAKELCNKNGSILFFAPSSMKYWGIEDEIAGHIKRYEFEDFQNLADFNNLRINKMVGLTFPLSNWLFKVSNYLITKNESDKLSLSQKERTVYTGNRNVPFKTTFPKWMKIFLNEFVMYPFYLLQKANYKNKNSMVIATEFIHIEQ